MKPFPMVCTLTDAEQAKRQWALQQEVASAVEERVELEDGYALRFPGSPEWIANLAELVVFERACCRFLTLELAAEPDEGPVWLRLRGPEGTKAFLERSFALCKEA
jgi:hypothetical protein